VWTNEVSIDIQAGASEVYAYLADFPRHREWSSARMSELKAMTPGRVAVGSEFQASETVPAKVVTRSRITALEPSRRIAWHSSFGKLMAADWEFELTDNGEVTRLVQRSRWQPGNLVMELFHRLVRRRRIPVENLHSLERIKSALEKVTVVRTSTPPLDFNYEHFSFSLEDEELSHWLHAGPKSGEPAPDFNLPDIDGRMVQLSDLRGRAVIIEFGAFTCPIFSDRVPAMESLAERHPEATFLVIYTREAHPGEVMRPHRSQADKLAAARRMANEENLNRRVLVDDLDGSVLRAYGGAWNPVYIVGPDGTLLMRRAWNDPNDVETALAAIRAHESPRVAESIEMVREPGRAPMGLRLLQRGGRQALLDFFDSAPDPIRQRLLTSPSGEVRSALDVE